MLKNNEQLTEALNQTVDTSREFIKISLEMAEKLAKLNLDTSKKCLEETIDAIRDLTATNNPKDLFENGNNFAANNVEKHLCHCRDAYEIITYAQSKVGEIFEKQLYRTQQFMTEAVNKLSQLNSGMGNFQDFGKFATNPVTNWMSAANHAMATMGKVAEQATEFTKDIQAATTATINSAKKATTKK
jgi:phasin family protein